MEEFVDFPNADIISESSLVGLEPTVIDPLAGFGSEDEFYTYYRVDEKVFTELFPPLPCASKNDTTSEKIVEDIVLDDIICEPGQSVCPKENCKKSFSSDVHLRDHVRRVHNASHKYECAYCKATFPVAYRLKKHLAVHTSAKTTCPVCSKILSVRTSMSHHMKLHSKEKPYQCVQCGKEFAKKTILALHLRFVHRSDKLRCLKCHQEFKRRLEYQKHLSEHVKERTLACEFCGKLFSTLGALGAHKAKKHEIA